MAPPIEAPGRDPENLRRKSSEPAEGNPDNAGTDTAGKSRPARERGSRTAAGTAGKSSEIAEDRRRKVAPPIFARTNTPYFFAGDRAGISTGKALKAQKIAEGSRTEPAEIAKESRRRVT